MFKIFYYAYGHRLVPAFGLTNSTSAKSCKEIKERAMRIVTSGVYWVQGMQVQMLQ